jgi:cobalt-zinc-cadmium efflux system outer membrane protein
MPLYNRQQGNLEKARQIVDQTRTRLVALERGVLAEVDTACDEFEDTADDMVRYNRQMQTTPARNLDPDPGRVPTDPAAAAEVAYLKTQIRRMNDNLVGLVNRESFRTARDFYNAAIKHRKSVLRLNTTVGCRVID